MPWPRNGKERRPGQVTALPDNADAGSGAVVTPMVTAAQLAAWFAAVEHLHAAGLPAAVPPFAAAWLRRRGVRADWVTPEGAA